MIDGWMGKEPRRWLKARAKEATNIIEVGCWKGRSTMVLAKATRGRVWAVDHWQGVPDDPHQNRLYPDPASAYTEFRINLAKHIASGRVHVMAMSSEAAARQLSRYGPMFDFAFIDGDHSYEAVRADIANYSPLVRPGGIIAGHDYKSGWPGVVQAVDEAFGRRAIIGPKSIWSVIL